MSSTKPADAAVRLMGELRSAFQAHVIHAFVTLRVADELAEAGRSVAELTAALSAEPAMMRPFLGACEHLDLIQSGAGGTYSLTERGRLLRSGSPLAYHARWLLGPGMNRSYEHVAEAVRTGQPGSTLSGQHLYDYFAEHPGEGEAFDEVMSAFTGDCARALVDVHDFSSARRIVDIGGGRGILLAGVLAGAPQATGVLYDMPRLAEPARRWIAAEAPSQVAERIELVSGSFFEKVPPAADTYILKSVVCDWDDDAVRKILSVIWQHMDPGARLLLVDWFGPEPDDADALAYSREFFLRATTGGRVRPRSELTAMVGEAGFTVESVSPEFSPTSGWSLVVARR